MLLSLVYALLFIPVPAARLLKARAGDDRDAVWLSRRYEAFLRGALARPAWVIAVTLIVAVAGGLFYFRLETGFLPEMDEGGYVIDYVTPPGTSLPETDRMVRRIETILAKTPEIADFTRRTGTEMGMFATEQNSGDILVRLKPRSARDKSVEDLIESEREQFAREMSGMTIEFVQILQDMLGDLEGAPEPVEVKVFGDDIGTLETLAARLGDKLKKIDGLVDLVEPRRGNPELEVRIDPTRAAKAGFTTQDVSTQLVERPARRGRHRGAPRRSTDRSARSVSGRVPVQCRRGFASIRWSRPRAASCRCRRQRTSRPSKARRSCIAKI